MHFKFELQTLNAWFYLGFAFEWKLKERLDFSYCWFLKIWVLLENMLFYSLFSNVFSGSCIILFVFSRGILNGENFLVSGFPCITIFNIGLCCKRSLSLIFYVYFDEIDYPSMLGHLFILEMFVFGLVILLDWAIRLRISMTLKWYKDDK